METSVSEKSTEFKSFFYEQYGLLSLNETLCRTMMLYGLFNYRAYKSTQTSTAYDLFMRFMLGFRFFSYLKALTLKHLQKHRFHLVTPSPWPLYSSISTFVLLVSVVSYVHRYEGGGRGIFLGLLLLLVSMFVWWRDVIRESTWQGHHTVIVQRGLRMGFVLFIVSEVMFFFSIFWAFFHSSLSPAIELGSIWPPIGIEVLDPWKIPALNTLILLMSGLTITLAHHGIIAKTGLTHWGFLVTVVLAVFFTALQVFEYINASFDIADGVYGSTFFLATGFHGFHVFIGTCFITVCWIRYALGHFNSAHHVGFESAAWYWHFVDVVWLFLFVTIYWWGSF
jgi:cytochrome c oxidase subunit 3